MNHLPSINLVFWGVVLLLEINWYMLETQYWPFRMMIFRNSNGKFFQASPLSSREDKAMEKRPRPVGVCWRSIVWWKMFCQKAREGVSQEISSTTLDIQIPPEKVFWVHFGGPNTFSECVWMSRAIAYHLVFFWVESVCQELPLKLFQARHSKNNLNKHCLVVVSIGWVQIFTWGNGCFTKHPF